MSKNSHNQHTYIPTYLPFQDPIVLIPIADLVREFVHLPLRCYQRATLDSFARHHETGEPLPEDLYQRLVAAKNFR